MTEGRVREAKLAAVRHVNGVGGRVDADAEWRSADSDRPGVWPHPDCTEALQVAPSITETVSPTEAECALAHGTTIGDIDAVGGRVDADGEGPVADGEGCRRCSQPVWSVALQVAPSITDTVSPLLFATYTESVV